METTLIIVADVNSQRRQLVSSFLAERGMSSTPGYSLEKTNLLAQRNRERPVVIVSPASAAGGLSAAGARVIPYPDDVHLGESPGLVLGRMVAEISQSSGQPRAAGAADPAPSVLLIGSSTGGFPVALEMLDQFRTERLAVVLCQHVSSGMSEDLASALAKRALVPCEVVQGQTEIQAGRVYLLAGGNDYGIRERYGKLLLVPERDFSSVFHPSFNLLTESLLSLSGARGACVILSGLGSDGSLHLAELARRGVEIVAQDPSGATAPGMPSSAIRTGGVSKVLPVDGLKQYLRKLAA